MSSGAAHTRATKPDGTRRYVVARVEEVPSGGTKMVEVEGHEIGIFHLDGEFFALLNRCPHAHGPLCGGQVFYGLASDGPGDVRLDRATKLIMCPWHGWEFDLATGRSYCDPKKVRVRPYPLEVERGAEIAGRAEGPYTATTYPVEQDGDYLVITLGR
jgi:3-phenylpropionate/trans-cinnamate dioxygenase ferredoxin subunit